MTYYKPLTAVLWLGTLCCALAGCGGGPEGGNVTLADAGGTVTYKNAPLAGAMVTFTPEDGPIATGRTDLQGKFKLSTGGMSGVALGKCKATVTAYEGSEAPASSAMASMANKPANEEEGKKMMEAMRSQMQNVGAGPGGATGPKSIIPTKYASPATTDLSFTVEKDASKNQFAINLID